MDVPNFYCSVKLVSKWARSHTAEITPRDRRGRFHFDTDDFTGRVLENKIDLQLVVAANWESGNGYLGIQCRLIGNMKPAIWESGGPVI